MRSVDRVAYRWRLVIQIYTKRKTEAVSNLSCTLVTIVIKYGMTTGSNTSQTFLENQIIIMKLAIEFSIENNCLHLNSKKCMGMFSGH